MHVQCSYSVLITLMLLTLYEQYESLMHCWRYHVL